MAPRSTAPRERDYDFANVGVAGRRTGIRVDHRPLDDQGFEQVSSFFSSPSKSLSSKRKSLRQPAEIDVEITPKRGLSTRRSTRGTSAPPPRSASPKKLGITGSARRSNAVDVFATRNRSTSEQDQDQDQENRPLDTPNHSKGLQPNTKLAATLPRRFNPDKTPLRDRAWSRPRTTQPNRRSSIFNSIQADHDNNVATATTDAEPDLRDDVHVTYEDDAPFINADDETEDGFEATFSSRSHAQAHRALESDDAEIDRDFERMMQSQSTSKEPTKANSRRKRTADVLDEVELLSSPAAKRAKRRSDEGSESRAAKVVTNQTDKQALKSKPVGKAKSSKPAKSSAVPLSRHQEAEIEDIIERVRTRPGAQKSLYILRRENPADDSMMQTRSGRISVKPLAYWRNERCVYGGSPSGVSLADGTRFPMNSIREIIRTEEVVSQHDNKKKRGPRKPGKKGKSRSQQDPGSDSEAADDANEQGDPHAEPWETDLGTLKGPVSIWDHDQQAPIEDDQEVDIAYAAGAIQTKEVKGSDFTYAKLLSTRFFSTGIVELPPGALKRPKNSRKMHMSFFVAKGRVSVEVGPMNGPATRFSIGKGGVWQVPRGNQYSILNKHDGLARIFFSQACEPVPIGWEEH